MTEPTTTTTIVPTAVKRLEICAIPIREDYHLCLVDPDRSEAVAVLGEPLSAADATLVGRWLADAAPGLIEALVPYLAIEMIGGE